MNSIDVLRNIIGRIYPGTPPTYVGFMYQHNSILTWIKTVQTLLLKKEKIPWHIQYKFPLPFQNIVLSSVPMAYNIIAYEDFTY